MHVLYFHQHFSTPAGSTGIRSYKMAKKLIEYGHTVTVVCGSYKGANTGLVHSFKNNVREGNVDGIHVVEFNLAYANQDSFLKRTAIFLRFAYLSMKYALSAKYDLIFATSTPLTIALPGLVGKWCRRKPFIFEVRDLWPELPREMGVITNPIILKLMGLVEWMAYKSADALIALSPGIQKGILRFQKDEKRVTIIPNGSDIDLFAGSHKSVRPKGVEEHHLMAIFAGTHGIANGLQSIINSAKILKERQCDDVRFVLIGQGKLKDRLIQQANELGLDNIIFLDPVDKDQLSQLLACADIGMQILANVPAFYDGTSPNKFFDYIAAGLPVLINYPGWLAEKISNTGCGVVVEPDNAEAFCDALINLAKNRQQLSQMGESALMLAKSQFDRDLLSKNFVMWLERWA
ncbi:glycosyltransferase family 4 protein [Legionella sp. WA2024007413]